MRSAIVGLTFFVAACSSGAQNEVAAWDRTTGSVTSTPTAARTGATDPTAAATSSPVADATPATAMAIDPATPVAVVHAYYAAIGAHRYDNAYRLQRNDGKASGKTLASFTRGFADTASTQVETGTPAQPQGAAGSTYVTVPVAVNATTAAGTRQRFEGSYVLRRVNDVPGASRADRRWRIDSATLIPVH